MGKRFKAFFSAFGKGFRLTFPNGWAISVQFGPGNYCENHYLPYRFVEEGPNWFESNNAEFAILSPEGELQPLPSGDTVWGYADVMTCLNIANIVASLPANTETIPDNAFSMLEVVYENLYGEMS